MGTIDHITSPLGTRRRVSPFEMSPPNEFLLNSSRNRTFESPTSPLGNPAAYMSSSSPRDATYTSGASPWVENRPDGSASFWSDRWKATGEPQGARLNGSTHEVLSSANDGIAFYPPKKWGDRGVDLSSYWSPRLTRALAMLVCVQCIIIILFKLAAIVLFVGSDASIFWAVPYLLAILVSAVCLSSIHLRDYIATPIEITTRFDAFLALFTLAALSGWAKFSVGCSLISWMFAAQLDFYQGLVVYSDKKYLLNEENLYVIMSGAWIGSILFLKRHFNFTRQRIRFPVVQRMKFLELQAKARPTLKKSVQVAFWPLVSFTLGYHFAFGDVKHLIVAVSVFLNSSTLEIERCWYELFNLRRFLVAYLCGILTVFTVRLAKTVVRIFLLSPREFGIELFDRDQKELCLSEALNETRLPLVRALAFRYLVAISGGTDAASKACRRNIYILNPTGDVPSEWNAVRDDCLEVIKQFSSTLDDFQGLALGKGLRHEDVIAALPSQLAYRTTRMRFQRDRLTKQRNAMGVLERARFEIRQFLKRLPWLLYLFDEEKEHSFDSAVRNCQNVLYAVRSLACLIAMSVSEDQYGVVLQDVERIVPLLSSLKDKLSALRKVNPLCHNYSVHLQRSLVKIWLAFPDTYGQRLF